MPIFMDRHDVSDTTTAENVAQLHQEDLKIQDQFGCRGLTYWFDSKRKIAFCLIEATDKNAILKMHGKAHGNVPHQIIEVEPSIVESFLGRIEDPEKAMNTELNIINDPAFRTIMVLKFEPLLLKQKDDTSFKLLLKNYSNAIIDVLNNSEGNVVKQSEDKFLVSFKSVSNAIHASSHIKSLAKERSGETVNDKIVFKIALSAGVPITPVTEKKSIFEDTRKLAERMCQFVSGEIIISAEVKELYNSENRTVIKESKSTRCLTQNDENFLNRLIDYIELNWRNPNLKIDDYSKALGYSRSQLYRSIISLTGHSPNVFIKEYRLNEALKLLNRKTNNISEVAFETGFTTQSYFSKCFQRKYGYLPSGHSHQLNTVTANKILS